MKIYAIYKKTASLEPYTTSTLVNGNEPVYETYIYANRQNAEVALLEIVNRTISDKNFAAYPDKYHFLTDCWTIEYNGRFWHTLGIMEITVRDA